MCVQVYLLLDEFIMGGELQETSKKVDILCTYTMRLVDVAQLVWAASHGWLGTQIGKQPATDFMLI